MVQVKNLNDSDDIISQTIKQKRVRDFDRESGVTFFEEDTLKKANSDDGLINYQNIDVTLTESGAELEKDDKIFYCFQDGELNRWRDGFQCHRCRHLFYIGHLGHEEKTGQMRTVQRTLKDGTTQSSEIEEKVRYCRRCWLLVLSKRVISAPFRWSITLLAYPLGHNVQGEEAPIRRNEDQENEANNLE